MKLEELQRIQLNIVKELKRVCLENDINFFLVDGTALGAYYINDFIPWDDDIDIGMYIDDYMKFIELSNKMNENFVLKDCTIDGNFGCSFGQLINKDYKIVQENNENSLDEKGVFIDIHPFVKCSEKKIVRIFDYYKFKFFKLCLLQKRNYMNKNEFKYKIFKLINLCVNEKKIISYIQNRRKKQYNSKYAIKIHGRHKEDIIDIRNLKELKTIMFSNEELYIMPNCKEMLDKIYGEFDINKNEENRHRYIYINFIKEK